MNAIAKFALAAAFAASSAALAVVHAAGPSGASGTDAASGQSSRTADAMSEGEVRKVDKEAGKITLKHGPLVNLDMPPMTMVFRVTDPAMLNQVKPGDKVRFVAGKVAGAFTVLQLENAQ